MLDQTQLFYNSYIEKVVEDALGKKVLKVERFTTGLSHFVFDVTTEGEFACVVRITTPERKEELEAGVYWQEKLEKIDIPLPTIYQVGQVDNFPFIIYERLLGNDLEEIYPQLTPKAKKTIAHSVAEIQQKIHQLSSHHFIASPQWSKVLQIILKRSEREILRSGVLDRTYIERTRVLVNKYEGHFKSIGPVAFLYDTNIRNVIIHNNKVSGIIDVDEVWYGDPLLTIGRGKTLLLAMKQDTDYIRYWCEYLGLSKSQMKLVDLYSLLYCVRFMGTLGQELNGNSSIQTDISVAQHLKNITEQQLGCLE